ncbi:MAG: hypothetical protein JJE18_01790 [Eubacteriaceae bacterium]|nr:hypothetical protein [Eubacteriaceae bacterium]
MAKTPVAPGICPKCGKSKTMEMVSERQGGISGGKAALGAVLLGPIGLIGGALGKKKVMFQCSNCGYTVEK